MSGAFVGVAAAEHVAIAVAGGFCMFAHGGHKAVLRVAPGSWVSYYSPRERLDAGEPVRAFTAIGKVAPGEPQARDMGGQEGWSRRVDWLEARPADVYPLLEKLSFVRDKRHWGMAFRRSLFAIPMTDLHSIAEAMGAGRLFEEAN